MNLPTQVLGQVIGHTNLIFGKDEFRRQPGRISVSKTAMLTAVDSPIPTRVTIIDLSAGGVGLVYSSAIATGDMFTLKITGRRGDKLEILCGVMGCKRTTTGRYRISAEFLQSVEDMNSSLTLNAVSTCA